MNELNIPDGMTTRLFVMERNALNDAPEALRKCFPGKRPWTVADGNTWRAAGSRLQEILERGGMEPHEPFLFPAKPILHAEERLIPALCAAMPQDCVPVAVGGGTINDLVKRAAGVAGVEYLCIPTACSVDGYTSAGAAMNVDGFKKTMPCPPPACVLADEDVLSAAPPEMFASGYADLAAKVPAGADWIIADELGLEPIRRDVWDLVQKDLKAWLARPEDVAGIFLGLAATGYAMQLYGESRPASGAEHMCSHVWEMEGLSRDGEFVSHGFKVAIGSLASTAMMERVFAMTADEVARRMKPGPSRADRLRAIAALLERGVYGAGAEESAMKKFLDGDALAERRRRILDRWEPLRSRVRAQLIPFEELRKAFALVGAPADPRDIALNEAQFRHGIMTAQLIRTRYSILDVLFELGLLEEAADAAAKRLFGAANPS